jgi:hypothetical protein
MMECMKPIDPASKKQPPIEIGKAQKGLFSKNGLYQVVSRLKKKKPLRKID